MKSKVFPVEELVAITSLDECPYCPACHGECALDEESGCVYCPACREKFSAEEPVN